jgi:hypothetical protein
MDLKHLISDTGAVSVLLRVKKRGMKSLHGSQRPKLSAQMDLQQKVSAKVYS